MPIGVGLRAGTIVDFASEYQSCWASKFPIAARFPDSSIAEIVVDDAALFVDQIYCRSISVVICIPGVNLRVHRAIPVAAR